MKRFVKIFLVTAAIIFLNAESCAAEDLRFLDSKGDVGYFVDMDSFKPESDSVFVVNLVVIRINLNQMDVVNLRVNQREKTYAIRWTKTFSYDERTELKSDTQSKPARSYREKSLLAELAQIATSRRQ